MMRYSVKAQTKGHDRPTTIAASNFIDVCNYIKEHAAEILDPDGTRELVITVEEYNNARFFFKGNRENNDNGGGAE